MEVNGLMATTIVDTDFHIFVHAVQNDGYQTVNQ